MALSNGADRHVLISVQGGVIYSFVILIPQRHCRERERGNSQSTLPLANFFGQTHIFSAVSKFSTAPELIYSSLDSRER